MEISHTEKLLFERTLEKLSQAERALGEARMDMHMLLLQRQQLSEPEQSGESVGQSTTEQQAAEQQAAMPSALSAPAPQPSGIVNPAGPRINPGVPHINPGAANPPVQPAPLTRPPIQPTPVYSAQANIQPPGQPGSQADQVLPARSRWWTSEQIVVRVIATLGTLITIAGVFFLVVLAIQNGLLGPLGRVILASVFSAVMGGIGVVAHKRHAHKAAVGAFCTTSLLSAMATVFSLVVILEWWPEPAGTATIIALTISFIALATVWNEEGVAIALGIGASIVGSIYFASCVNYVEFSTIPGTLAPTALAIAAYIRKWSKGIDVAVIFTLITAFFYALLSDSPAMILPTTPVVVITAVIFVAMGANTERTPWNPLLTIAAPAVLFGLGALGLEAMPSLSTHVSTRPLSWVLIAGSICYIAIAIVNHNKALIQSGSVFLALSFLPVYVMAAPLGADVLLNKPIVVCIFLLTAIGVTWWMTSGIKFRGGVWFCWAATALILTYMVTDGVLSGTFLWLGTSWATAQAVAIIILLLVALRRRSGLTHLSGTAQSGLALVSLHLSMLAIVSIATYLGGLSGNVKGGYLIGHATVSVLWMLLACYVLLRARFLSRQASLIVGLVLAFASIGKLMFFDFGNLHGLPRVAAFIISGVVLLAIAALRNRQSPQKTSITAAEDPAPLVGVSTQANSPTPDATYNDAPPASDVTSVQPAAPGQVPPLSETPLPSMSDREKPQDPHNPQVGPVQTPDEDQ